MVRLVGAGRPRQCARTDRPAPRQGNLMPSVESVLARWQLDVVAVRERIYRATTPRERERWHALWLWSRGWTGVQVAEALGRDAHTIGTWVESFCRGGPASVAFSQTGGS